MMQKWKKKQRFLLDYNLDNNASWEYPLQICWDQSQHVYLSRQSICFLVQIALLTKQNKKSLKEKSVLLMTGPLSFVLL